MRSSTLEKCKYANVEEEVCAWCGFRLLTFNFKHISQQISTLFVYVHVLDGHILVECEVVGPYKKLRARCNFIWYVKEQWQIVFVLLQATTFVIY
jgi:hypothetical protein